MVAGSALYPVNDIHAASDDDMVHLQGGVSFQGSCRLFYLDILYRECEQIKPHSGAGERAEVSPPMFREAIAYAVFASLSFIGWYGLHRCAFTVPKGIAAFLPSNVSRVSPATVVTSGQLRFIDPVSKPVNLLPCGF